MKHLNLSTQLQANKIWNACKTKLKQIPEILYKKEKYGKRYFLESINNRGVM